MNRRRSRLTKSQTSQTPTLTKKHYGYGFLLAFLIICFLSFMRLVLSAYLSDEKVITVGVLYADGSGGIDIYNFETNQIQTLLIPANTIISLSRDRGEWKTDSIKKIIEGEKVDPVTISDSFMKTFTLPIDYWAYPKYLNIISSTSNISRPLRLKIGFFKLFRAQVNQEIQLADSSLLYEETYNGENVYKVADTVPASILKYAADPVVLEAGYRIEIVRKNTSNYQSVIDMSEVLSAMGAHVISIRRDTPDESNCIIEHKETVDSSRVASLFNCSEVINNAGNLDMRIIVGEEFSKRF